MRKKVFAVSLAQETFLNNDSKINAYTGLPSWEVFYQLHCVIESHVETVPNMSTFLMLLVTLMRLRLNVSSAYLSFLFDKNGAAIETSFRCIIGIIAKTMRSILQWPTQGMLYNSLTNSFKKVFSRGVVIVDILDMPIDLPIAVDGNGIESIKCVVAMSVQKTWIFVSDLITNNPSNKEAIEKSGILSRIEHGNSILCGLNIESNEVDTFCGSYGEETVGVRHLVCEDDIQGRLGSKVRYHIIRATGQLKRKFGILNSSVPLSFVTGDEPLISKIIETCCILSNFCDKNVCFHKDP